MKLISKILVSALALVPLFSFALIETHIEPPKDISPIRYSEEYNTSVIQKVWKNDSSIGLAISKCESGYNNVAVNYTDSKLNGHVSRGLFQMSEIHGKTSEWWNPTINATQAYKLYKESGAQNWLICSQKLGLI